MNLTVAICTHRRGMCIRPTLDAVSIALQEGQTWKETPNVLVIANACKVEDVNVVREWMQQAKLPVELVQVHRPGLTLARMEAVRRAGDGLIVFCDDDVEPLPGVFGHFVALAQSTPKVGSGGGLIQGKLPEGVNWPEWLTSELREFLAVREISPPGGDIRSPPNESMRWLPPGAFCWFRTEALQEWLKGQEKMTFHLDRKGENLWSSGDMEMHYAIMRGGWQVIFEGRPLAVHRIGAERLKPEYLARLLYWIGRSDSRLAFRLGKRSRAEARRRVIARRRNLVSVLNEVFLSSSERVEINRQLLLDGKFGEVIARGIYDEDLRIALGG